MSTEQGHFRFDVDAALLFQLGEELVARRSVALAELIKNAYDADASKVSVIFRKVAELAGEIQVSDNGTGMSFDRIRDTWMRIATSDKALHPVSGKFHRPRAGAKGIGRFAARRLARQLLLQSVTYVDPANPTAGREHTTVHFNWDDFTPGKRVQDVPVRFERSHLAEGGATGVTLRLLGVRDAWTEQDLEALHNDLTKLISPAGHVPDPKNPSKDPGFSVEIVSDEFPEAAGTIEERFLRNALAVLHGTVSKAGKPRYRVKFRGRKSLLFSPRESRFPSIGEARFTIHFFVYKTDFFAGLSINVREAQQVGREQGGVHVYMDRFRVPPYGDPGDDWLKLDEEKGRRLSNAPPLEVASFAGHSRRPMLHLPGNNQLFGRVHLSRFRNPSLRQTLNRERLVEDESFEALRRFLRLGINWLTVLYARDIAAKQRRAKPSTPTPIQLLDQARQTLEATATDLSSDARTQVAQAIDLAKASLVASQEEHIGELSMLRVLASTGTMIVVFDHQLLGILEGLRESHRALEQLVKKLSVEDRQQFRSVLAKLDGWIRDARHQGQLLGLLIGRRSRLRRRALAIRPVVSSIGDAFSNYMRTTNIHLENRVPPALRTPPMFECELSAVLINLMTNALKAVRTRPVRRITIEAAREGKGIAIRFSDTGVGANRKAWEDYFKPFVSESEPDSLLGSGTGLGLKRFRRSIRRLRSLHSSQSALEYDHRGPHTR